MEKSKKTLIISLNILSAFLLLLMGISNATHAKTKASIKSDVTEISGHINYSDSHQLALGFIDPAAAKKLSGALKSDFEYFLAGVKFYHEKNYTQAIAHLEKMQPDSLFSKYSRYFLALANKENGALKKALNYLPETKAPVSLIEEEIFWLRLSVLAELKEYARLVQDSSLHDKRLKNSESDRARLHEILTRAAVLSGKKNEATAHIKTVLVDLAGTPSDLRLTKWLSASGMNYLTILPPQMLMQRAEKLISIGQAHDAVTVYQFLLRGNGSNKKLLLERVAFATFKAREYHEAATLYEQVLKSGNYTSPKTEILEKIAQAHARHDDFDRAIQTNKAIVSEFPSTSAASIADFKLGFLLYDAGRYKEAVRYFEKYVNKGTPRQKDQARWYRLWSYYWLKDYKATKNELTLLIAQTKEQKQKRSLKYWLARVEAKMGLKLESHNQLKNIIQEDDSDFYGMLSRQRLRYENLDSFSVVNPQLVSKPAPDFSESHGTINQDATNLLAQLLMFCGLDEFAYDESSRATATGSFGALIDLQRGGNYVAGYVATRAGKQAIAGTGFGNSLTLAYPRAYATYIDRYTDHFAVPKSLPFAIMRQESTFKPRVESSAFATGLMQIIPPTAYEIATDLGMSDFDLGMLRTPRVNSLFGTYYLSKLLKNFNGNLVYAIASYNAGPDAVGRWSKKALTWEADEFIESIPYSETRDYVKKVLMNYWTYEKLY